MSPTIADQLSKLDGTVQAAVAEITRLRAVNRELEKQLEERDQKLAVFTNGGEERAREGWKRERETVRQRLDELTGKLESLLVE